MMTLSFFQDLFLEDFMLRALLTGIILGALAPLIGSIVVVRRLSFIAEDVYHSLLTHWVISRWLGYLSVYTSLPLESRFSWKNRSI